MIGEVPDAGVHIGQSGRLRNLLMGELVHGEGDVVGDGVGEQIVVLGHVGAALPQGVDSDCVDVAAVYEEGPVWYVVGPQDQIHQSGLAAAGLAHQAHVLPGFDPEAHVLQHVIFAVGIAEAQMPELDLAPDLLQWLRSGGVHHVGLRVQQRADAL